MGALTAGKETPMMNGPTLIGPLPVGAGKKLFRGAVIVRDDATGTFEPGSAAADKTVFGVLTERAFEASRASQVGRLNGQTASFAFSAQGVIDNTAGGAGDLTVLVEPGVFKLKNKGGDLVTAGVDAYVQDDQTVRATGAGTSKAGPVIQIDPDGDAYVLLFCPNHIA